MNIGELLKPFSDMNLSDIDDLFPFLLGGLIIGTLFFLTDLLIWGRRNRRLVKENSSYENRVRLLNEDNKRTLARAEDAEGRISLVESESSRLATNLRELTSERDQIRGQLNSQTIKMQDVQALESTQVALQERAEEAETRIISLEGELTAEREKMQTISQSNESDSEQVSALQTELSSAQKELSQAKEKVVQLQAQQKEQLNAAAESGNVETGELRRQLQVANDDITNLRAEMERKAAENAPQIDRLQQQIEVANSEIERLRSAPPVGLTASQGSQGSSDAMDELRRQLQVANNELSRFKMGQPTQQSADAFAEERTELEGMLSQAEERLAAINRENQASLTQLVSEKNELAQKLQSSEAKAADTTRQDQLEAKVNDLESRLNQATTQLKTASSEKETLAQKLQSSEAMAADTTRQDELQAKLNKSEAELKRLFSENETILSELQQARAAAPKLDELEQTRSDLQSRLTANEAELSRLSDENDRVLAELNTEKAKAAQVVELQRERDQLLKTIQQKEEDVVRLQNSQSATHDLQAQLDASNSRNTTLMQELNIFKEQAAIAAKSAMSAPKTADFLQLSGVGHVFARRLHEANITSFSQLSNLSPEQVTEIVQPQSWQDVNVSEWIRQARDMSGSA